MSTPIEKLLALRHVHFPQLNDGDVYADFTGAAHPPRQLIDAAHTYALENLRGNPHSHHAPSAAAMQEINEARRAVLNHFNAGDDYEVIWTSGATAAILLLQHLNWNGGELLLTADQHNSINGLRETARRNGAVARYAPITDDLTLDSEALRRMIRYPRSNGNRLFAMPAKSNYSGVRHSLDWISFAHEHGWAVLLDAAAFVSNDRLDLSVHKPDYVPISFYKMFGYPTGVGCMLIRREGYNLLHKRWFAGGSILLVSVMKDFFAPETLGYARYEDGTVNFGAIPLIREGLKFHASLGDIKSHTTALGANLHQQLSALRVGENHVRVHSPLGSDIVTFSVVRGDSTVPAWIYEAAASADGIYVRTGCFCNPGVNEKVFGYTVDAFERFFNDGLTNDQMTLEKLQSHSGGKPIGAIRASFGYMNTVADVQRIADFTRAFLATA